MPRQSPRMRVRCLWRMAPGRTQLRQHFARRHPFDSICITEEGLLPQCHCCGLRCNKLRPSHYSTDFCKRVTRQRLHWARALRQLEATKVKFYLGDATIENVSEFLYLGRILHNTDLDDAAVALNLRKARMCWNFIHRIPTSRWLHPARDGLFLQDYYTIGSSFWIGNLGSFLTNTKTFGFVSLAMRSPDSSQTHSTIANWRMGASGF